MAPDKKDNKRKAAAAVASDSPAKKTKKVEAKSSKSAKDTPKSTLKTKKTDNATAKADKSASTEKTNGGPTKQIKPRKRAADFLSDNDSDSEVDVITTKAEPAKKGANKKSKKEDTAAPAADAGKKSKAKKAEVVAEPSDDEDEVDISVSDVSAAESEDEAEDDQTIALLKGFESSGDEDDSGDEGFDPSQPVPTIPDSKKAKRKLLKKQKKAEGKSDEPGTVYVGRIPHGFYEHQMKAYFSQFGEISRLRLSRNRITGKSKHYAFIEFSSAAVARIVAGTMDNYLMYGHILKCKYVPAEQLHPEVWKGANRRFKVTPWNRIEQKRLEKGKTREQWADRIEKEQKRRLAKAEKLKALGLDYEIELPQLMSVDDVPVQEPKAIEDAETAETAEEPVKAIETPAVKDVTAEKVADDTPKKAKKAKKGGQTDSKDEGAKVASEQTASPATKATGKAKKAEKGKKTKAKA